MKRFLGAFIFIFCGALGFRADALPNAAEIIPAKGGAIRITPIFHGSLQIEYKGKVIQVDPFSGGDYSGAKKADLILITHTHPDHFDAKEIVALRKPYAAIVLPEKMYSSGSYLKATRTKLGFQGLTINPMKNGDDNWPFGIRVEAVPMYNLARGPKPGAKFHPKGEGNGYVLTLGGKRIYIAGDTEATPEMKALKNIVIAFLPMNLPYTMTPQEAAVGARAFKPKVVYPYHYRYPFTKVNDNPQQFAKALAGSGIEVRLRDWYHNAAAR